MESKKVTKKFLNNYVHHSSEGFESVRFFNDEFFLKIINQKILSNGRRDILPRLEELEHKNVVTPEFLLTDRTGLIGYGAKNYMDYSFIDSIFVDKSITLEDRKKLMIRLANIIEFLKSKDFAYYDIHSGNILYKDSDIKLLDIDGGVFKGYSNNGTSYDGAYRFSNWKLAIYTISFIYKMDFYDFYRLFLNEKVSYDSFIRTIPDELKKFYEHAIKKDFSILENIPELIDRIDQATFEESNEVLKLRFK